MHHHLQAHMCYLSRVAQRHVMLAYWEAGGRWHDDGSTAVNHPEDFLKSGGQWCLWQAICGKRHNDSRPVVIYPIANPPSCQSTHCQNSL
jgi:hypothetical protein